MLGGGSRRLGDEIVVPFRQILQIVLMGFEFNRRRECPRKGAMFCTV